MAAERVPFELALEVGVDGRRSDGRPVQVVTLTLPGGVGDDAGSRTVRLRPAEARDLAVRLLEVAHQARRHRGSRVDND